MTSATQQVGERRQHSQLQKLSPQHGRGCRRCYGIASNSGTLNSASERRVESDGSNYFSRDSTNSNLSAFWEGISSWQACPDKRTALPSRCDEISGPFQLLLRRLGESDLRSSSDDEITIMLLLKSDQYTMAAVLLLWIDLWGLARLPTADGRCRRFFA